MKNFYTFEEKLKFLEYKKNSDNTPMEEKLDILEFYIDYHVEGAEINDWVKYENRLNKLTKELNPKRSKGVKNAKRQIRNKR